MRLLSEMIARSANGTSRIVTPDAAQLPDLDALEPVAHKPPVSDAMGTLGEEANLTDAVEEPTPNASQDPPSRQMLAQQAMEVLKARAGGDAAPADGGGRVKTRLLGFNAAVMEPDVFGSDPSEQDAAPGFPVGWLVVVHGPGTGTSFTLHDGVAQIGRGDDQPIRLDFGDTAISRANHAAVAYDGEQNAFFLGHGGKANIVRLNDQPVLSTEQLQTGDEIRIGETTLRFVAFCDDAFAWDQDAHGEADGV